MSNEPNFDPNARVMKVNVKKGEVHSFVVTKEQIELLSSSETSVFEQLAGLAVGAAFSSIGVLTTAPPGYTHGDLWTGILCFSIATFLFSLWQRSKEKSRRDLTKASILEEK